MPFPTPEYHSHEEFQNRSRKLEEIRALGIDPYPPKYVHTQKGAQILLEAEGKEVGHSEDAASGTTQHLFISGRLVLFRAMGKNAFAHIQDETGRIQVMFNRDQTKVHGFHPTEELTPLKFIEKKLDLGDIIGVEGHLFKTQRGEITLFAKMVTLLSKSLLPLPDKHSGLADKGVRYRKRWLDLITHAESLEKFRLRSRILFAIRKYFEADGFEEVETPVLQNIYGGAAARPFSTHLNALDQSMFLRISPFISENTSAWPKIRSLRALSGLMPISFRVFNIFSSLSPSFTILSMVSIILGLLWFLVIGIKTSFLAIYSSL